MAGWVEQVEHKAFLLQQQMRSAAALVSRFGAADDDPIEPYAGMLRDLYRDELPIARVLDSSDLVLQAEGPALTEASPGLKAVNWLCQSAEKQIRHLAVSVMDLSGADLKRVARLFDLRLTGLAPGSLYAGFRLESPEAGLFQKEDEALFDEVRDAIRSVAKVPAFIEDERMNPGLSEAISDPATRDAAMEAAMHLSPTGRLGVHTVNISAPGTMQGSLSLRERVVLRAILENPVRQGAFGSFVGDVREMDLDTGRIHLRNIPHVGALRCVVEPMTREQAKQIIGATICVEGRYETDRENRPRLIRVERMTVMERPIQEDFVA